MLRLNHPSQKWLMYGLKIRKCLYTFWLMYLSRNLFLSWAGCAVCIANCNATDNFFLFNICMLQIRKTRQDKYERRSRGKSVRCSQAGSCSATDGTCWAPIESWGDTLESGSPSNLHKTLKRVMIEGNIVESWGDPTDIHLTVLPANQCFYQKKYYWRRTFFPSV